MSKISNTTAGKSALHLAVATIMVTASLAALAGFVPSATGAHDGVTVDVTSPDTIPVTGTFDRTVVTVANPVDDDLDIYRVDFCAPDGEIDFDDGAAPPGWGAELAQSTGPDDLQDPIFCSDLGGTLTNYLTFQTASAPIAAGDSLDFGLEFTVDGTTVNGGDTITVNWRTSTELASVAGQSIRPAAGPLLETGTFPLTADDTPPSVAAVSATTRDTDGNGQIDAYEIVFDEAMADVTFVASDWTVGGATVTFDTGVANDATIFLEFAESGSIDTGATPDLLHTPAGAAFSDFAGNELPAIGTADVTESDGVVPEITSASTVDSDSNGQIDAYEVVFSEPMDDSTFDASEWFVDGTAVEAVDTDCDGVDDAVTPPTSGIDDGTLCFIFAESGSPDTGDVPELTYSGTFADTGGNVLAAVADGDLAEVDAAAPLILSAATVDDGNGQIDAYAVVFSEPIVDSTFDATEWNVGGIAATGLDTGLTIDDDTIFVEFDESGTPDTDATPELTYSGGLEDAAGNVLADVLAADVTELDAAVPVILRAIGNAGGDTIRVFFSEGVFGDAAATEALEADDFDYFDNVGGTETGAGSIVAVGSHNGGDTEATLTLDAILVVEDLAGAANPDQIVASSTTIADAVGNLASTAATVLITPELMASANIGSNEVLVTFPEDVESGSGGNLDQTAFSFTPALGGSATGIAAVDHDATGANAHQVTLTMDAPISATDVDTSPALLSIRAGKVFDQTTNTAVDATEVGLIDITAPAVDEVLTLDTDGNGLLDAVQITFSEPIDDDGGAALVAGDWSVSGGHTVTGISTGDAADDNVIVLTIDEVGTVPDTGDILTIGYSATSILDFATPANRLLDLSTGSTDGAAPLVVDAATQDLDEDGRLDAYLVTFSENINDLTVRADEWFVDGAAARTAEAGACVAGGANDDQILVCFYESASLDTGALPDLTYVPKESLTDAHGNAMPAHADAADITERDDAPPRLIGVEGNVGSATVTLTFSEGVEKKGGGDLDATDIKYNNDNPGGASGISSLDHTAGDATATATLNAPLVTDDFGVDGIEARPDRVQQSTDPFHILPSVDPVIWYEDAPKVVALTTLDADGNGLLDSIRVDFSEEIDEGPNGGYLVGTDWSVDYPGVGLLAVSAITGDAARTPNVNDDATIFLMFPEQGMPGTNFDTDVRPSVSFMQGGDGLRSKDDGTLLQSFSGVFATDGAPSLLLSAATQDLDGNGQIDGYAVTFSEAMDDSSFAPGEWMVDGYTVTGFDTDGVVDDTAGIILFDESGTADTAEVPDLSFLATGAFSDLNGVSLVDTADQVSAPTLTDGAAPVLVRVTGTIGGGTAFATFSEPVEKTGGGDLDAADFLYDDVSGSGNGALDAVSNTGDDTTWELDLNLNLNDLDFQRDTLAPKAGNVQELGAGTLPASGLVVNFEDGTPPTIVDVLTLDTDGNGLIDELLVTFSESIDDGSSGSNLDIADWSLDTPYTITGIRTDTLNDESLTLEIEERTDVDFDTGVTPELTYVPGSITDHASNALAGQTFSDVTDGVQPHLVDASTIDFDANGFLDGYELVFSEGVDDSTFNAAVLDIAGRTGFVLDTNCNGIEDADGAEPGVDSADADDATVCILMDELATPDTAATPDVTTTGTGVFDDLATPTANAVVQVDSADVTEVDEAAPIIVGYTVSTVDADGNGLIDAYEVIFSEPVDDLTFDAADWTVAGVATTGLDTNCNGFDDADAAEPGVDPADVSDDALCIRFAESEAFDVGATPELVHDPSGTLSDAVGNELAPLAEGDLTELDELPPHMVAASTVDFDANGQIDAVRLVFSEPVSDASYDASLLTVGTFALAAASLDTDCDGEADSTDPDTDGSQVDDATVCILLDESGTPDTAATPDVTTAGTGVFDDLATPTANEVVQVASADVTEVDEAAPVIVGYTAATVDSNGDGEIDAYELVFSEPVDDDSFVAGDWTVGGVAATGLDTGTADDETIRIVFAPSGTPDTGATPELVHAPSGTLSDAVGNGLAALDETDLTELDEAAPVVLSAVVRDLDGNGIIDAYELTMSEPISDASFDATDLTIDGHVNYAVDTDCDNDPDATDLDTLAGSINDNSVCILFDEAGQGTEVSPDLTTTSAGLFVDLAVAANPVPAIASGDLLEGNVAGPVVISASTLDRDGDGQIDAYEVVFSEPVVDSTFEAADWTVDGVEATGFMTAGTPDDDTLWVLFDESGMPDTHALPQLNHAGGNLADGDGNLALALDDAGVGEVDTAAPALLSAVTRDFDESGQIDAYELVFSEAVSDTSFVAADWFVGGVAVTFLDTNCNGIDDAGEGAIDPADIDDATLCVLFAESGTPDTDATPELTHTTGNLADPATNLVASLADGDVSEVDDAPPILVSVSGNEGEDTVTATFSEGVATTLGQALTRVQFAYDDLAAGDADSIASVTHTAGDATMTLRLNTGLAATDLDTDTIAPAANAIFGVNDDLASPTNAVTIVDLTAPHVVLAETVDDDGNGLIDRVRIELSEAVDDGTLDTVGWSVDGYSILGADSGTGVDDNEIFLDLTEAGASGTDFDTDATPDVEYSGGNLADTSSNGLADYGPAAAIDGASPVIAEAATIDTDENGLIDQIRVTFSEEVFDGTNDAALDTTNWDVDPVVLVYAVTGISTGAQANDAVIILEVDGAGVEGTDFDTGDTPDVSYTQPTSDALRDFSGNKVVSTPAPVASVDRVSPLLIGAETADEDGDGQLDAYRLTFSEPMDDATFFEPEWDVEGRPVAGFDTDGVANDEVMLLLLTESGTPDTGVIPAIDYTATATLRDLPGNEVAEASVDSIVGTDGAAPVLLHVRGEVDSTVGTAIFSEGVDDGAGGDLGVGNFDYLDVDTAGNGAIDTVVHTAGESEATLNFFAILTTDDFEQDQILVLDTDPPAVKDADGNVAAPTPVSITDVDAPEIVALTTLDLDGNGLIDAIQVTFSEVINDGPSSSNLKAEEWTLEAPYGDVDGHPTEVVTGLTGANTEANDEFVYLLFDERTDVAGDTGVTPTVEYTSTGTIEDHSGNAAPDAAPAVSDDGAAPVILSATTLDADGNGEIDTYSVVASEPISDASLVAADWLIGGTPATGFETGDTADDDAFLILFAESSTPDTGETPELTHTATLEDAAGNTAAAIADGDLAEEDGAAPVIVSATTRDIDGNGQIDAYEVVFSEAVDDASVVASDWFVDGTVATGFGTGLADDDDTILILFDESGVPDTGATPELTHVPSGTISDGSGNGVAAAGEGDITEADGAPPAVLSAVVGDSDGNGFIDHYALTFSEAVSDASFDFTTAGLDIAGHGAFEADTDCDGAIDSGGEDALTIDDDVFCILFDETIDGTTDVTPDLTTTATGLFDDLAANEMVIIASDDLIETNAAPPAILSATTVDADGDGQLDAYEVVFSEAVVDSTFVATDWFVDGNAATGFDTGDDADDDTILVLFAQSGTPDTGDLPDLSHTEGSLADAEGNLVADTADADIPTKIDGAAPVLIAASTVDADSNGVLDGYDLLFSEAVADASFDATKITIGSEDTFGTSGTADDATLRVTFAESGTGTSETPDVTADAGMIADLVGIPSLAVETDDIVETDGVVPVLQSAQANPAQDTVTLTFSEGVVGSGAGGALVPTDFTYTNVNGVGASGTVSVAHTPGEATAVLTVSPAVVFDDVDSGGPPDTVTPKATIRSDNDDDSVSTAAVELSDTVAPTVDAMFTVDSNGDGTLDSILLVFSEAVKDSTVDITKWSVAGATITAVDTDGDGEDDTTQTVPPATETVDDNVVALLITTTAGTADTPEVTFDGATASVTDLIGNELATFGPDVPNDGAAPVITAATTADLDANGQIDAYVVTFGEAVDDSTFDADDWTVGTDAATGIETGDMPNDATIVVRFAESGSFDTDATPPLVYTEGTLADAAGNAVADDDPAEADGAPPVLVAVGGIVGDTDVLVRFSEGVERAGALDLTASNFVYSNFNSGDAAGIAGITHTAGDAEATLELNVALTQSDFDADEIAASTGSILGTADGLAAPDTPVGFSDLFAPEVLALTTRDTDGNGLIDAIELTFNEPVDDTTLGATGWDVDAGGYTVSGMDTGDTSNDNTVFLRIDEAGTPGTDFDTDAMPAVEYDGSGAIEDLSGNALVAFGPTAATDGAAPVVVSASTVDADGNGQIDGYLVTVSEDLDAGTVIPANAGDWLVDGGAAADLAAGGAADEFIVVFTESGTPDTGVTPQLTHAPSGTVADGAGNGIAAIDEAGIAETDGAGPAIVGANGAGTTLVVTFSEGVAPGLAATDFDYGENNAGGATDVIAVSHTAGDASATLTTDAEFDPADFGTDTIAFAPGRVDADGNTASTVAVEILSNVPPTLLALELDRVRDISNARPLTVTVEADKVIEDWVVEVLKADGTVEEILAPAGDFDNSVTLTETWTPAGLQANGDYRIRVSGTDVDGLALPATERMVNVHRFDLRALDLEITDPDTDEPASVLSTSSTRDVAAKFFNPGPGSVTADIEIKAFDSAARLTGAVTCTGITIAEGGTSGCTGQLLLRVGGHVEVVARDGGIITGISRLDLNPDPAQVNGKSPDGPTFAHGGSGEVAVSAVVETDDGVQPTGVHAHYRIVNPGDLPGGTESLSYSHVTLTTTGSGTSAEWTGTIPGVGAGDMVLFYFTDDADALFAAGGGSPSEPQSVLVV